MKTVALKVAAAVYFLEGGVFGVAAIVGFNAYGFDRIGSAVSLVLLTIMCLVMGAKALSFSRKPPSSFPAFVGWGSGATLFLGSLGGAWTMVALVIPFLLLTWAIHREHHDA